MTAQQMTEEVYKRLIELPYSRKINTTSECYTEVDFDYLPKDVREAIKTFPILEKTEYDWMAIDNLDGKQQFYIISEDGGLFLIDTQGYEYPRYVTRLRNFDNVTEDPRQEMFERAESFIRIMDGNIFTQVVNSMATELYEDGFEYEDIVDFLQNRIINSLNVKA